MNQTDNIFDTLWLRLQSAGMQTTSNEHSFAFH